MEFSNRKAQVWIEGERDPEIRKIKLKILAHVTYVSAKLFKRKLKTATDIAFQKIRGDARKSTGVGSERFSRNE